ncbi:MAG: tetratricopeptide repeat protein, partial [Planctomycetes bacterium]|nr:tetratricopeptide repeat protein [Planctomycetota bacterium]
MPMFYKKQIGRHAVVIVLATIPAMSAHGVQVIYLPPMLSAPDSDAAALYRSGCQSLEAGDTSGAIEFLSQAVRAAPSTVEYQLKLSDAYVAGERPEAAARLLESAFARHAENPAVRTALARLHHTGGRLERVEELLAAVEDQLPPELLIALSEAVAREPSRRAAARTIIRGAVERFPANLPLRLSLIDAALARQRYAGALSAIDQAESRCGYNNELHFRAARAYFELGQLLGKVEVRKFRDGRAGQFLRRWLLVEEREEQDSFLCCPEQSALYQLRRALDAGLDTAQAPPLHA